MLQDYKTNLKQLIPSDGLTLARVAQLLNSMRSFQDTTDVYGPAKSGRIVSFLKLYPQDFKIQGTGAKIRVFIAERPAARPVQVGGASSSGGVPAPRTPRAPEMDPRAQYRRFPNELQVEYKDENPAREGSERFNRYERYKRATTIGQARRLGATSQDISLDLEKGAVRIV